MCIPDLGWLHCCRDPEEEKEGEEGGEEVADTGFGGGGFTTGAGDGGYGGGGGFGEWAAGSLEGGARNSDIDVLASCLANSAWSGHCQHKGRGRMVIEWTC
jgi:hypothetical protein